MPQALTNIQRYAIWKAWKGICYYSGLPLEFNLMQIDHLIPQSKSREEVAEIINKLKLPKDFSVYGFENMVPCLPAYNRKKSDDLLQDGALLLALEHSRNKVSSINEIIHTKTVLAKKDRIMAVFLAENSDSPPQELINSIIRWIGVHPNSHLDFLPQLGRQYVEIGDIEILLHYPIKAPSAVGMVNLAGMKAEVNTVADWQKARSEGYVPDCNCSYKNTSEFIKMYGLIKGIKSAKIPIKESFKGLNLSSSTIVDFLKSSHNCETAITPTENGGYLLIMEDKKVDWSYIALEIMRADFQGDGQEEIMLFRYSYALRGTAGRPDIVYLGYDAKGELTLREDDEDYGWGNPK